MTMRSIGSRSAIVAAALLTVAAVAVLSESAGADPAASRIIDRTFRCSVELRGGIREIEVQAGNTAVIKGFALFDVSTHWVPDFILAGVGDDVVHWNPRRCKAAGVKVPLEPRSLTRVPPWGEAGTELDCETPRQILIRVRAIFRAPVTPRRVSWSTSGGFSVLVARGKLVEGTLGVRTRAGKPLVYAVVDRKRQARLFTAPTCVPD